MSNLLKKLGDNWHTDHPYLPLIEKVLPTSENKKKIEDVLLEIYVDEQNGYKLFQTKGMATVYDMDIDITRFKRKELNEEKKKEEERFNKLIEKFEQLESPESSSSDEETVEEHEEEEMERRPKGVQKSCARTLKAEEEKKRALVKSVKSSMATSQQNLMDLNKEIELLEKKEEYYIHYQRASYYYQKSIRETVQEYRETKNIEELIKKIDDIVNYYNMLMRRYVPLGVCDGKENGLCDTHFLPLRVMRYSNKGEAEIVKCILSN